MSHDVLVIGGGLAGLSAAINVRARGKRVLDCFTHTGSFALNAVRGGAEQVPRALRLGRA